AFLAEGEGNVLGGHLIAIVEFHALPELQFHGLVVNAGPFDRKARYGRKPAQPVTVNQRLPDTGEENAFADIRLFAKDVERIAVRHLLHGNGDRWAIVSLRDSKARQDKRTGGTRRKSKHPAS